MQTDLETYLVARPSASGEASRLIWSIRKNLQRLASAVDEHRASQEMKNYLAMIARFHRYSWHNTLLIVMQKPRATRVAGFRTWKKLGRRVRKGETGIRILAPCVSRAQANEAEEDQSENRIVKFYRTVTVFDVSQTDGQPLPEFDVPDIQQAADDLLDRLKAVAASRGIAISEKPLTAGHYGRSTGGSVIIATGYSTGQQAKTLAQELAHEAMHHQGKRPEPTTAELEAEAVAYIVCTHFGLSAEMRASRYIALWGGNAKALAKSLSRISKTARALIGDATSPSAGPSSTSLSTEPSAASTSNGRPC